MKLQFWKHEHVLEKHYPINPYDGEKSRMADATVCTKCKYYSVYYLPDDFLKSEAEQRRK